MQRFNPLTSKRPIGTLVPIPTLPVHATTKAHEFTVPSARLVCKAILPQLSSFVSNRYFPFALPPICRPHCKYAFVVPHP